MALIPTASSPKQLRCSQCSLVKLCLPVGLNDEDMMQLESIIETSKIYKQNESVYRAGDPFHHVYAVKSGMFQTVAIDANGDSQIVGFHLPGELFGLDAIYPGHYTSTPVAVSSSIACSIDFKELSTLATQMPSLQHQLLTLMSKEMHASHVNMGDHSADQKIAGFILSLSTRYKQRGYSANQFQLLMSRKDIANHLGMAPETVSRLLKRLINEDVLDINQSDITIKNMKYLQDTVGH